MKQLKTYQKWCKQKLLSYGKKLNENDEMYVFISEYTAEPVLAGQSKRIVDRITKRTSLSKITVHGLRHTHCTVLLNRGVNVKVIAERLGNTPDMVYKVYGHVLKEMETESVSLFSQSLQTSGANQ